FGIGTLKEGGGRGFLYTFLGTIVLLWIGYFFLMRWEFRYRNASFIAFGLVLLAWVVPAWRIELAVERQEEARFYQDVARVQALDVHDEPLASPRGNPLGVRIRYTIALPSTRTLALDPQLRPLLDGVFPGSIGSYLAMEYAHTQIEPPPPAIYPDSL